MGKPMIIWTCEAARDSGLFDVILVSTEDEEIGSLVKSYGFKVDERPHPLASDEASTPEVCYELFLRLRRQGRLFDVIACLYATAPLRRACDIRAVLALLDDPETDFAHAVTGYGHSPYQMMYQDEQGFLVRAHPLLWKYQSQALPLPLIGNGSTYAAKAVPFLRERCFSGPRLKGHRMPLMRSVDIDTAEDYELAKLYAERLRAAHSNDGTPDECGIPRTGEDFDKA